MTDNPLYLAESLLALSLGKPPTEASILEDAAKCLLEQAAHIYGYQCVVAQYEQLAMLQANDDQLPGTLRRQAH